MAKMDLLSYFLQIKHCDLTKTEKKLLEIKLFFLVYAELHEIFKHPYKDYNRLIPFNHYQEKNMLVANVPQEMINDILSTKEYSLSGIAAYTNTPEEILSDIASGINTKPSLELSLKVFEVHMTVRCDRYRKIIDKVLDRLLIQKLEERSDKD